ncbi:hypothetical protein [Spiroplasma endosymbiont of Asaphidion curtum]
MRFFAILFTCTYKYNSAIEIIRNLRLWNLINLILLMIKNYYD